MNTAIRVFLENQFDDFGIIGNAKPHEIEALMDEELQTLHRDKTKPYHALNSVSESLPALGIVAAVLGVIKAMGALDQSPELLGALIGAALWIGAAALLSVTLRSATKLVLIYGGFTGAVAPLGTALTVPTLEGEAKVKVPAGSVRSPSSTGPVARRLFSCSGLSKRSSSSTAGPLALAGATQTAASPVLASA